MNPKTHYIVVRRDLPFGVLCAQIAHAAGESFYALRPGSSEERAPVSNQEVAGSNPARGSTFNPSQTIAVILGARNEHRLKRLAADLLQANVPHVVIQEPDPPYDGQCMAIGLVPGDKSELAAHVRGYHMLPNFTLEERNGD